MIDLKEIIIPDGVEVIEKGTFKDCTDLKKVDIPKTLRKIGDEAFENCISLEEIKIPEGVIEIGDETFLNCKNLKRIVLPKSIRKIGDGAFENCTSLEEIKIPERVEAIHSGTFAGCNNLKRVILPKSIVKIGSNAFTFCSLEEIEIPDRVTEIEYAAFWGCIKLKRIVLPKSLKKIGELAFNYCTALEVIEIPDGVEAIEYDTFDDCEILKRVILPQSIRDIDETAFNNCPSLVSIQIKYDSYQKLETFINNNIEFLKKYVSQPVYKKEQLAFIGENLTLFQKLLIAGKLGLDNYIFESPIIINQNNDKLIENNKEKKIFSSNPEINEKINKIYELISLLSEETQRQIKSQIEPLIKESQELEEEMRPVFGKQETELKLTFGDKKTTIISSLDNILFKLNEIDSFNELLKKLEHYKAIIDNNNIKLDKTDYISDNINEIILLINDFDESQKEDIKNKLKKIIDDTQKDINKKIDTLFDNNPFNNQVFQNYMDDLSLKISKYKDNIENIYHRIIPLKQLLQKLTQPTSEYITDINDIADTVYSTRAIIDKIPEEEFKQEIKKELEESVEESVDYINNILSIQQYEKANYQEVISKITSKIMIILVKINDYNSKSKSQLILDMVKEHRNKIQSIDKLVSELIEIEEIIKEDKNLNNNIDDYSGIEQLLLNTYLYIKNNTVLEDKIKEEEKNKLLRIVEDRINILNSIDDNSDNYYQQLKEIISEINKLELMIAKSEDDIKRYEDFTSNTGKKTSL